MGELPFFHFINDSLACALGLILNVFLVVVALKTGSKVGAYNNLVLVGAVYDILFSIFEWLSLHQLLIKDGVMFVMPHGLEQHLYKYCGALLMIPHCFVGMHGLWILAALYHYRFCIVTKPTAPLRILLKDCLITSLGALAMAFVAYCGVEQAMTRGFDYYLEQVDEEWFDRSNNSYFLYSMDFRDSATLTFFFVSFAITIFCFGISIYYAHEAWKFVVQNGVEVSKKTSKLQSQFTKSLIAQTANAVIFSVIPISVMCLTMQFRLNYKYAGLWVMSFISWLAAANAILTIIIIKSYRIHFLRYTGISVVMERLGLSVGDSLTYPTTKSMQRSSIPSGAHKSSQVFPS